MSQTTTSIPGLTEPGDPTFDPIVPQPEVARLLGITADTVRNLRKTGKLKAIRVSARRVGVRRSELIRYVNEREGA